MIIFIFVIFINQMLMRIIIFMLILIDVVSLITIIYLVSISDMNNKNINIAIQLTIFIGFINTILFSCICISNYYKNRENTKMELMTYIDNTYDIIMINTKINEYISDDMTIENKIQFIKLLETDLRDNKRLELLLLMLNRLKIINEPITEEIFKNELDQINRYYDDYKNNLTIKINGIIELQQLNTNIRIV